MNAVTVQIFHNPASGSHDPNRLEMLSLAFEELDAHVILSSSGPGYPAIIDPVATHIVAVGGDGTARHIVIAMRAAGRDVPLAIYPAGTINLIAREMRPPTDVVAFAQHVLTREPVDIWPVQMNDSLFLACASVGPDAEAVTRVSTPLKARIGRFAYAASTAQMLAQWPQPAIHLEWDGGAMDCQAFYVAKGRYYAGPWSFAPDAALTDKSLHVVALIGAGRMRWAAFMTALAMGRTPTGAHVRRFTCNRLDATSATPVAVQADGDDVGKLPLHLATDTRPVRYVG